MNCSPCHGVLKKEQTFRLQPLLVVMMCLAPLASGCGKGGDKKAPKLSPPKVVCTPARVQPITDFDEFVGRTEAVETVEIRSRVSGFLETIDFVDGASVKEGDLLATIETEEYAAIHQQSLARIALWESKLELGRSKLKRSQALIKTASISQEELDESVAGVGEAEASLVAARADAARTELDVKYTKIFAPIAGRIDRALVTPGNMLTGGLGSGTLITQIVSVAPIYAYLDVDEASILRYIRKARGASAGTESQEQQSLAELNIPCYLQLNDELEAKHVGKLDFVENRVDKSTGTIRLRAVFSNEDRILRGGMFVRAKIPVSDPYDAVLIPETAIGTDQGFKFAYVVDAANKASRRTLKLGGMQGSMRIILDGIKANEKVIVRGIQRVRPGSEVAPVMEEVPTSSQSAPNVPVSESGKADSATSSEGGAQ